MSSNFYGQIRYENLHRQSLAVADTLRRSVDTTALGTVRPEIKRAMNLEWCASQLIGTADDTGNVHVWGGPRCKWRLCPFCLAVEAGKERRRLAAAMTRLQTDLDARYIVLTLTVRNVPGAALNASLDALTDGWRRMVDLRPMGRVAVHGWYRTIEITRNQDGSYHPHIHAIIATTPDYFRRSNKGYLSTRDYVQLWRKACRLDYDPICDVRAAYNRRRNDYGTIGAAVEAAKYAVKSAEYCRDIGTLRIYANALTSRRLRAYGGTLKAYAKAGDQTAPDTPKDGDTITYLWNPRLIGASGRVTGGYVPSAVQVAGGGVPDDL